MLIRKNSKFNRTLAFLAALFTFMISAHASATNLFRFEVEDVPSFAPDAQPSYTFSVNGLRGNELLTHMGNGWELSALVSSRNPQFAGTGDIRKLPLAGPMGRVDLRNILSPGERVWITFEAKLDNTFYGLSNVVKVTRLRVPNPSTVTGSRYLGRIAGTVAQSAGDFLYDGLFEAVLPVNVDTGRNLKSESSVLLFRDRQTKSLLFADSIRPLEHYSGQNAYRLVKATLALSQSPGQSTYRELEVFEVPATAVELPAGAAPSPALANFLSTSELSFSMPGPRSNEQYSLNFPLDEPAEVLQSGELGTTVRYSGALTPSGSRADHLPYSGIVQAFVTFYHDQPVFSVELLVSNSHTGARLLNQGASAAYDDLFFENLALKVPGATSLHALSVNLPGTNFSLYQSGASSRNAQGASINLFPELNPGQLHAMTNGQSLVLGPIVGSYGGHPGDVQAERIARHVLPFISVIDPTNPHQTDSFFTHRVRMSGFPDLLQAGYSQAEVNALANDPLQFRGIAEAPNCNSGRRLCLIPGAPLMLTMPKGGNMTGGDMIDSGNKLFTLAINTRGPAIRHAITMLVAESRYAMARQFFDAAFQPNGEMNTIDWLLSPEFGTARLECLVEQSVMQRCANGNPGNFNPRYSSIATPRPILDAYQSYRSAGEPRAPYFTELQSFEPNNDQHAWRTMKYVMHPLPSEAMHRLLVAWGEVALASSYADSGYYLNEPKISSVYFGYLRNPNSRGLGITLGRTAESYVAIAKAVASYEEVPERFREYFYHRLSQSLVWGETQSGLLARLGPFDIRTFGNTQQNEAFRLAMSQHYQLDPATTVIAKGFYNWESILFDISVRSALYAVEGNPDPALQSQLDEIKRVLRVNIAALHDPSVGMKNDRPLWAFPAAIRDAQGLLYFAPIEIARNFANEYSGVEVYQQQGIGTWMLEYPGLRQALSGLIPTGWNIFDKEAAFDPKKGPTVWGIQRISQ